MFILSPHKHMRPKDIDYSCVVCPVNVETDVAMPPVVPESPMPPVDAALKLHSDGIKPPTMVRGRRRGGQDDYWILLPDMAIRVHLRPRRQLFVPSSGNCDKEGEPKLSRLGKKSHACDI